jgi:CRISPR-associated protein (TIGR03986 family)
MTNFVYPFNFVLPANQPLRRGEFHKLHRYKGKTGRIAFTLTNLSPLFIPDSEQTTYYFVRLGEDGKRQYHRVMDFFNANGRLAIPSTSLKGMIRSVAETLSNSSFGAFTPSEGRFAFRKTKDLGGGTNDLRRRRWGRWQANETVEPLEAAKIWRADFDAALGLTNDDQRNAEYNHLRQHHTVVQTELWQLHTGSPHVRAVTGKHSVTVFGSAPTAIQRGQLRVRGSFKSEVVCGAQRYRGPMLQTLRNALHLSGNGPWNVEFQTITKVPNGQTGSREERVCWIRANTRVWNANQGVRNVILWPRKGWEDMEPGERANSHYITALYPTAGKRSVTDEAKGNYRDVNAGNLPNPGDIVRYYEENGEVVEFGPVAMFKTPELATVREIAQQTPALVPCQGNNSLCPACRLFGWTSEEDIGQGDEKFPVAGRLRVSIAWSDKMLDDTQLLPLKILGSPKPGYYPFYLRPPNGNASTQPWDGGEVEIRDQYLRPPNGNASTQPAYYAKPNQVGGWWHTPGLLRGRKFYLHHPGTINDDVAASCNRVQVTPEMVSDEVKEKHQRGETITPEELRSHQNSTASVLPPGAEFKCYLEFESLSDYELGLLLWAVSLSDSPLNGSTERAHKLGMGRPIGMGSVRVKIDSIVTWDPIGAWRNASDPGEQEMIREEAERLVKVFKTWMLTGQETADDTQVARFDNEEFYQDLCAVLSLNLAGNDPVQYYPPGMNSYEGYTYFVEQRQKRNQGREQPLRTPRDLRGGRRQTWP